MLARTQLKIGKSVPSEAGLEANVLRYLANCLERRQRLPEGGVTVTLPTQPEEKYLGFDAATDLLPGLYVLLQFKRPKPTGGASSFRIQTEQLLTLVRSYPPGSAFYVLPHVESNKGMWDAQAGLLGRACMVDAWDVLAAFCPDSGPRAGGNPLGRKSLTVRIDGCDPCKASVRTRGRGVGGPLDAMPAADLCGRRPAGTGFVVAAGGRIRTRGGGVWSYTAMSAEASKRLWLAAAGGGGGKERKPSQPPAGGGGRSGPAGGGGRSDLLHRVLAYLEGDGMRESDDGNGGSGGAYLVRIGDAP